MASLKNIVSALQREIAAALEENKALPGEAKLQPGKVIVSVEVAFQESKTGAIEITCPRHARTANGASEPTGHRVTAEFNLAPIAIGAGKPASRPEAQAAQETRINPSEAPQVIESLSTIFGPPGFDSSARAAVFRDALADLSEKQAEMVVRSFSGSPLAEQEQAAKRARTLIVKILKTGPLKSAEEGGEILASIFERYKLPAILNLIGREWKTQENWMR